MVIRIASMVLSLAGILALILGLFFWFGAALNLVSMHMLLGLLAVGALWVVAIAQALAKGGSWIIAAVALIVGAITGGLGMIQSSLLVGDWHWVIQVIHVVLGILTIGLGHMGAARHRKGTMAR
jgi:hypothetical protein